MYAHTISVTINYLNKNKTSVSAWFMMDLSINIFRFISLHILIVNVDYLESYAYLENILQFLRGKKLFLFRNQDYAMLSSRREREREREKRGGRIIDVCHFIN